MRRIPPRLVFAALTAACIAASCAQVHPDTFANTSQHGTILVRPRPGVTYRRLTSGGTIAVLGLVPCHQPASDEHGHGSVGGGASSARTPSGDVLEIPPGGAPAGTQIDITRKRAHDFRYVDASADSTVTSARLSIDLTGCSRATGLTVAYWDGRGWTDMGGTVAGNVLVTTLPHLSVYAVAGN